MKTAVSSRKVVNLPDSVRQRLHPYTLAATAAGVTMLALVPPGEAEIIYTPANQYIYSPYGYYALDLTGDGTTDFYLKATSRSFGSGDYGSFYVSAYQTGNAVAGVKTGKFIGDAKDLPSGRLIGPKTKWGGWRMESGFISSHILPGGRCFGPWKDKRGRYLGLRFMINGEVHYGWAELNVNCFSYQSHGIGGELTGYAYETIPNKAIKAGQETGTLDESLNAPAKPAPKPTTAPAPTAATLGMLAKGAQALSVWRQE
ncbi:MAG: hypothetical protein WCF61_15910 [Terriglobales bacterium]